MRAADAHVLPGDLVVIRMKSMLPLAARPLVACIRSVLATGGDARIKVVGVGGGGGNAVNRMISSGLQVGQHACQLILLPVQTALCSSMDVSMLTVSSSRCKSAQQMIRLNGRPPGQIPSERHYLITGKPMSAAGRGVLGGQHGRAGAGELAVQQQAAAGWRAHPWPGCAPQPACAPAQHAHAHPSLQRLQGANTSSKCPGC